MSDDHNQRPYRSTEPPPRAPVTNPSSANDPLAELARLIGQNNSFANPGRDGARRTAPPPVFDAPPAAPADVLPYDPPAARRPYAQPSYAAADPYHAENQVPGYPAASADGYQADPYQPNHFHPAAAQQEYYDDAPPRRRVGILAVAIVLGLAVIGTAGAFGYRALYGSPGTKVPPPVIKADTAPSKIVPASASKTPSKLITDRVADLTKDEKLVSREEKPVELNAPAPQAQGSAPPTAEPAPTGTGVLTAEPKKIHTIAIRPDQPGLGESQPMAASAPPLAPPAAGPSPVKPAAPAARVASNAPVAAAPEPPRPAEPRTPAAERQTSERQIPERHVAAATRGNAPLSLSAEANNSAPPAPARAATRAPVRTAAAAAPAPIAQSAAPAAGGSYVQISSQRSEAEAQSAFRGLQAKYPSQLGNRQPVIRKVELGAKGTYYRAMVGPLAGNEASTLCNGLKAAGGSCLIQRN